MRCGCPRRPRRASGSARAGEPCQLWAVLWGTVRAPPLKLSASAASSLHRPGAGASRRQHIRSCFYQCLNSQSRCPRTSEIWIPRQQTPVPPETPNYSPCSSPYPGTMMQRSQESIYEPQEPPQPQSPASLPSPPRTSTPKDFKPSEPPDDSHTPLSSLLQPHSRVGVGGALTEPQPTASGLSRCPPKTV